MTPNAGHGSHLVRALAAGAAAALFAWHPAAMAWRGDPVVCAAAADSLPPARVLDITSEPPGAKVYRDSVLLGTTPLAVPLVGTPAGPDSGAVRLTILDGDPGDWFVPVVRDTVRLSTAGETGRAVRDTLTLHYVLPVAARITSDPPEAGVFLGDSLLGRTPLFASVPRPGGTLSVRKEGFRPQEILLGAGMKHLHATLAPLDPSVAPGAMPLAGVTGKSRTTLFIAAGTAVVTGAAAAWLKNRADNYYEEYQAGGDPGTLDRVRRYDLYSGIALSVAQISLGYLIVELLSR